MRRDGSRFPSFVRRIPADVRAKAAGIELAIPLGDDFVFVTPSESAQGVRFSLRTHSPAKLSRAWSRRGLSRECLAGRPQ